MINTKQASENTVLAYKRDLLNLESYLNSSGWQEIEAASTTALMAYVLYMHKNGKHAATVSRNITVIKNFYKFLYYERVTTHDPAHLLKAPKFTRQPAPKLSPGDISNLLETEQGITTDAKTIRNRAIIALIASTGLNSSTLINLTLGSVNCSESTLTYEHSHEQHSAKLPSSTLKLLETYINTSRTEILQRANSCDPADSSAPLFVNMNGQNLSRQGLWKIIKEYGQSQKQPNLNPRILRGATKND